MWETTRLAVVIYGVAAGMFIIRAVQDTVAYASHTSSRTLGWVVASWIVAAVWLAGTWVQWRRYKRDREE